MCDVVSRVLPSNKIPGVDQCDVTRYILYGGVLFLNVIELVIVLGVIYMVSYGSMLVI